MEIKTSTTQTMLYCTLITVSREINNCGNDDNKLFHSATGSAPKLALQGKCTGARMLLCGM